MAESQGKYFNQEISKTHKFTKVKWVYLKN
jgi:hypothetical protein